MTSSVREIQGYLYILGAAVGVALFVFTANELIFKNSALPSMSFLGNWGYWVFTLGIIMLIVFFYLYFRVVSDTRKFQEMINSESKNTFVKNVRELNQIARRLGPKYSDQLKSAKERWKVK